MGLFLLKMKNSDNYIYMIMLTRSSEIIFNPGIYFIITCITGYAYIIHAFLFLIKSYGFWLYLQFSFGTKRRGTNQLYFNLPRNRIPFSSVLTELSNVRRCEYIYVSVNLRNKACMRNS